MTVRPVHPALQSAVSAHLRPVSEAMARAAGAGGAVEAVVPKCSAVHPMSPPSKTNPPQGQVAVAAPARMVVGEPSAGARPELAGGMFPNVPQSSLLHPDATPSKTKPPHRETANPAKLSPRQLAAARLLVQGAGVTDTAAQIGVTRQTVGRWKSAPSFRAEVRRLHDRLALVGAC